MILKKLSFLFICVFLLTMKSNAQVPANTFITCLNHMVQNDTLFKNDDNYNLLITNDSFTSMDFVVPQNISKRFKFLKRNEIFFHRVLYYLYIDSFSVSKENIYLRLKSVNVNSDFSNSRIEAIEYTYCALSDEFNIKLKWSK